MTKRRAENTLSPDIPPKRCFVSLPDTDKAVGGVHLIHNAKQPVASTGHRCRKRPNSPDCSIETDNLPRKVATRYDLKEEHTNTLPSRTFEDTTGKGARTKQDGKQHLAANDKVMDTDEDLSSFNCFQFWRAPLPDLDLSLLETSLETMET
ncbi:hypothetical protein DNTS_013378 [Danionella cerebrum]|uniref:WW-binding domain-containing protein n=1 Tax=Danionella cerebrum TaxID=2873325 RepID=A0A553PW48_9TELE|nr:hypothetical protein DNTS_013378 [Danionella translucida]TRY81912.1 hypothetical protein DNTS_013378 [Danionella translucida]